MVKRQEAAQNSRPCADELHFALVGHHHMALMRKRSACKSRINALLALPASLATDSTVTFMLCAASIPMRLVYILNWDAA